MGLESREKLCQRIIGIAERVKGPRGLWLDVGAGHGCLLENARRRGWDVLGTEVLGRLCDALEDRGIRCCHTASSRFLEMREEVSVVTMTDSLFYFPDPLQELTAIHQMGRKMRSLLERCVGDSVFVFSAAVLGAMLERTGFCVADYEYSGAHRELGSKAWDMVVEGDGYYWADALRADGTHDECGSAWEEEIALCYETAYC